MKYIIKVKTKNKVNWYYQFELAGELQVTNSKKRASKFNERRAKELLHKLRELFPSEEFSLKRHKEKVCHCHKNCKLVVNYTLTKE